MKWLVKRVGKVVGTKVPLHDPPISIERPDLCIAADKVEQLLKSVWIRHALRSLRFRDASHGGESDRNGRDAVGLNREIECTEFFAVFVQLAGADL